MSGLWFGFSFCLFLQIENCVVKMACSWTCAYKIKAKWTKEGKTRTCLPFLFFLINIKITKQNFPGKELTYDYGFYLSIYRISDTPKTFML